MALSLYRVAPGTPCNLRAAELPHCLGGNFCHIWHSNSNSCWRMSSTVCQKNLRDCMPVRLNETFLCPSAQTAIQNAESVHCTQVVTEWSPVTGLCVPQVSHQTSRTASFRDVASLWVLPCGDMGHKSTGNQALLALYFWNSMLPVYLRPLHSQRCMGKETGILFPDIPYLSAFLLFCYS